MFFTPRESLVCSERVDIMSCLSRKGRRSGLDSITQESGSFKSSHASLGKWGKQEAGQGIGLPRPLGITAISTIGV